MNNSIPPAGFNEWYDRVRRTAIAYELEVDEVLAAIKLLTVGCYDFNVNDLAAWYNTHEYMQYVMGENYLKLRGKHERG